MKATDIIKDLFEDTADDIGKVFGINELDKKNKEEIQIVLNKHASDVIKNFKQKQIKSNGNSNTSTQTANKKRIARPVSLSDVGTVRKSNFVLK